MVNFAAYLKDFVTAIFLSMLLCTAGQSQDRGAEPAADVVMPGTGTDDLLKLLATPGLDGWEMVAAKIRVEWARSGSHAMDLLLQRAKVALEAGDLPAALEHATALTDHAPQFAEGWNTLAAAYFAGKAYGPAMDALERALGLNPDHFDALTGLGIILRETGDIAGALSAYQASQAIHPHRPEIPAVIEKLEASLAGQAL